MRLDVRRQVFRYAQALEVCLEIPLEQSLALHRHYLDHNQRLNLEPQV